MAHIVPPPPSESAEAHADWLEFAAAFRNKTHFISWKEHQRDLKIAGADELGEVERRQDEQIEICVDDTISELSQRQLHVGLGEAYPFDIAAEGIAFQETQAGKSYLFQLALSLLGHNAAPSAGRGDQIFEDLSAEALARYLGAPSPYVHATVFGFPRRLLPAAFADALEDLCVALGEGEGARQSPEASDQKDAHLDVVAWREFPDERIGKLIAFGQCATGSNWKNKYRDLVPATWCNLWMLARPAVEPIPAFFIPRRIDPTYWRRSSFYGGVVFDRCRISFLTGSLPEELAERVHLWTETAMAGLQ